MADKPATDKPEKEPSIDLDAEIVTLKGEILAKNNEIEMLQRQNIKLKTTILNAAMNIYGGIQ